MLALSLDDFKKKYILLGTVKSGVYKLKKRHSDDKTNKISFDKYTQDERKMYFIDDKPSYYCKMVLIKEHKVHEAGISLILNELVRNNFTGGFPYSECYTVQFNITGTDYSTINEKYIAMVTETIETTIVYAKELFDTNSNNLTDFSYGLLCFQVIHNLYISNKYAGFVHGDLYHGVGYNTAYTIRNYAINSNITHVTYRVINSETKTSDYYVFKLKTKGSIPFVVYYDFGLSDVNIPSKGIIGDNFNSRLPSVNPTGAKYKLASTNAELNIDQGSKEFRNIKRNFDLGAISAILNNGFKITGVYTFLYKLLEPFFQAQKIAISNEWSNWQFEGEYQGTSYNIGDNIALNEKLMNKTTWSALFGHKSKAFVFTKNEYNDYVDQNGGNSYFYLIGEVNKEQCAHFYSRVDNVKKYMDKIREYINDDNMAIDFLTNYSLMPFESHYDNGQIKESFFINLKDKKEGKYRKWYNFGKLSKDGNYVNGKKDGLWEEWYGTGKQKIKCTYIDGVLNGEYKSWYTDGNLKYLSVYKDGNMISHISYNEDGIEKPKTVESDLKLVETKYRTGELYERYHVDKNNKKQGLYNTWYKSGELAVEVNYKDGKLNGLYKLWYPNGKLEIEANHQDDKLNGTLKFEINFKDGKLNGSYKKWSYRGELIEEKYYEDSIEKPKSVESDLKLVEKKYLTGQLKEQYYVDKNNKKQGLYKYWFENGKLEYEMNYKDGKLDGLYKWWDNVGELIEEGYYENDKPKS